MENKTELAKEVIRKSFVMSVAPDKQNEYNSVQKRDKD